MTSKKARSCDSCARRRARWYCAADDAFLCHGCDASVHSANPLARRHHRLQLRSAPNLLKSPQGDRCPAWLRGFKRKARTPRPHSKTVSSVVPDELETSEENNNEEVAEEEEEQQQNYRVPVYDPVLDEYCDPTPTEEKPLADYNCNSRSSSNDSRTSSDCLVGFLPSETELAEFAADMESLLGRGLENDSFPKGELGLGDADCGLGDGEQIVKEELDGNLADAGNKELYENMYMSRETPEVNFEDCGSPTTEEEDELERTKAEAPVHEYQQRKKVGLRLDHQAIIAEWSVHGPSSSPWIDGERPQFGPDDCWLDCMGMWGGGDQVQGLAQAEAGGGHVNEGREARVSRYREKRRTRLFSKKIRYEVRKLNAEKRPRMKGRFVKRASFAAATPY